MKQVHTDLMHGFTITFCKTATFEERETTTSIVVGGEQMKQELDSYGCVDELAHVLDMKIGQSHLIGFPQGSFFGLIITRIA